MRKILALLALFALAPALMAPTGGIPSTVPQYFKSPAETTAGVIPTRLGYPIGDVLRYGADPTGAADSAAAEQAAINVEAVNGGVVTYEPGTYKTLSTLTLKSNVRLIGYGATVNYTGAAQAITSPATGVLLNPGIIGLTINGGATATKLVELFSAYHGTFVDVTLQSASTTSIGLDLLVNTAGGTNADGNRNAVFNNFTNLLIDGTVGTGIRMKGDVTAPTVVTLNSFQNTNFRGGAQTFGIAFDSWADSNRFSGVTRIQLTSPVSAAGIGVVFNSGTPASNVGVYANTFDHLAVDTFGVPAGDARIGVQMNWTKYNNIEFFFQEPVAAGGALVTTANTQSYYVNHIVGGTSNIDVKGKLLSFGGPDNPLLLVGGNGDISTQTVGVEVGLNRTGSGSSYIDLIGDTTFTAYGDRFIRNNAGANASTTWFHRGTGSLALNTQEANAPIVLQSSGGIKFVASDLGIAFFGGSQVGQTAGFGTPTGASVVTNFPGATATLVQTSTEVAELVAILKAYGLIAN